jgi:hypothetical protein
MRSLRLMEGYRTRYKRHPLIDEPGMRGFRVKVRGNPHEVLLPDGELPPDGVSDAVVLLDAEPIHWHEAVSRIRSRPAKS